ncbi:MAG: cation:dicarboxylase symporter family transporter [Phycisphaera sp.]|nr:cation:dicarboxylase symporter family transporter [Phycisphaera sp.]
MAMTTKRAKIQTTLLFAALVAAVVTGQVIHGLGGTPSGFWQVTGDFLLVRPLQMLVIPIVFLSVACGIASVGGPSKLGRLGAGTVFLYILSMLIAAALGAALIEFFAPGVGVAAETRDALMDQANREFAADATRAQRMQDAQGTGVGGAWLGILSQIFPRNPLKDIVEGSTMAAITAAILLGLGLAAAGERGRPALEILQSLLEGVMRIVGWILWLLPIGLFFFVTAVVARIGLQNIATPVLGYMAVAIAGLALHAFVVLPLYCMAFGGGNGWNLMWNLRRVFLTAFSTSSSNATLPVTIEACINEGGCSKRATRFCVPLGATMNMDGTALYEAVVVLFLFQLFGVDLAFSDIVLVVVTSVLAAIGAAGIPSAGLVTMVIVITAVNSTIAGRGIEPLPIAAIGVIIGVDRVVDMCRTVVNVWGDCVVAKIMSRVAPDAD